jgi:hypothetical protein
MKRVTTMLAVLAAASSAALADGRLEGRVGRTHSNVLLSGAVVRIPGRGFETTTGSDGRSLFSQVPAGEHRVSVDDLGFAPRSVTVAIIDGGNAMANVELGSTVEEIVVYGRQTASAASALNQQRAADGIRSLVSATDIGALPDQNAAEALSRVPGTYLERDQGEGRYVGIRGIDPNLNTTSINGLRIPAPEGDQRAIQLDVVPSELLATLEVANQ